MKTPTLVLLSALLSVIIVSGCTRSDAKAITPPVETDAARYKEGHGLKLSPVASKFIGLETGSVATRDVLAAKQVTAIPVSALLRTIKGDFVFVANGEYLLRTPVQIGANDNAWLEVKDGLYEGDTIVTAGTQALWLAELQATNGGVGCADGH